MLLATQNPGDFDYKARDNIGTWLVGKVAQDRAIEKMRNLLAGYPNVGPAPRDAADRALLRARGRRGARDQVRPLADADRAAVGARGHGAGAPGLTAT